MAYIYKIINLSNGKLYIGKTSSSIEERFKQHIKDSKKERCEKRPLYDAMNKYGVENFIVEQIEEVENDEIASEREQFWIKKLNTYIGFENSNGYNATLGGDSRRLYNYKDIAEKYCELHSVKQVCDYFNCDKFVVQNACKENNIYIIPASEQSKINSSKKIAQLNPDTEEIIQIYNSISDAFRALNKQKSGGISKACNENRIYLGYKWKYL